MKFTKMLSLLSMLLSFSFSAQALSEGEPRWVEGEFLVETYGEELILDPDSGFRIKSQVTDNTYVVRRETSPTVRALSTVQALRALQAHRSVRIVEPNYLWRISRANDSQYSKQWGLKNTRRGFDIRAEAAWQKTTGSRNVIVAVIDTGIDYRHADLRPNMWVNSKELSGRAGVDDDRNGFIDDIYGYNFDSTSKSRDPRDDNGHGTHCAGIIGAKGNNSVGISGVAWDVRLMALKFMNKDGVGTTEDAIRAIDYARKMGANIMSNSWGGGENSSLLRAAIQRAEQAGILFVAAAGNESANNDRVASFPANYPLSNVISVASINREGDLSVFSNFGRQRVHIGAPGEEILSTYPSNKYQSLSGTSMAAPFVSGVAALVLAKSPGLKVQDLRQRILSTARRIPSLSGKTTTNGLLDANAAVIQP